MAPASIVDEILRNNPLIQRDVVAHGGTWLVLSNGVLNIFGPLAATDARKIGAVERVSQIQFAMPFDVPVATLECLDRHVLAKHPETSLRETLNGAGAFEDLAFLKHLPKLRALLVDGNRALDLAPIKAYVALVSLGVGGLGTSLRPLDGYRSLVRLAVRDRVTDFETIGTFQNLERLMIDDRCPARLPFLSQLPFLRELALDRAAPKHLEDLVAAPALEDVSISQVKLDAAALAPIARISGLRRLALRALPQLTSLAWLASPSLEELVLAGMTGVRSLASLASLPRLTTLTLDQPVTAAQLAQLATAPALTLVRVRENDVAKLGSTQFRLEAI